MEFEEGNSAVLDEQAPESIAPSSVAEVGRNHYANLFGEEDFPFADSKDFSSSQVVSLQIERNLFLIRRNRLEIEQNRINRAAARAQMHRDLKALAKIKARQEALVERNRKVLSKKRGLLDRVDFYFCRFFGAFLVFLGLNEEDL